MFARRNLITIALLVFALVLVACSAAPAATPQTIVVTSPPIIQTSAPVVQTVVVTVAAPQPTAAPTKPPTGQSLTVAATWGGGEREAILTVIDAFTQKTGIAVTYETM
ncbi:MAG: hypothetical protein E6J26_02380, partial [Chloroflexi bacterium]